MRKIISTMWVTLDGFVAGPDDEMDWVGECFDEAMGKYEGEFFYAADTLLLGRVTYQSFAGSWPYVPDNPNVSEEEKEYARRLNAMQKIVFSRTLASADWNNTRLLREIDPAEIERLKSESGRDIIISGSPGLVQSLTNLGLIDEYQVLVYPLILGAGKPFLQNIKDRVRLKLVDSKTLPSGVMILYYQPK
ncbi:dihydrofolate reductase family protein [Dictyobacter aurantiacus]|uniref:Bacterial bifunctional deaminase-reductase C-terminal domain-containing protein n=1 Tax=Dictyobacter aurantiacus TaxID=1936993 RepID=A0A401ZAR6_9CHLR|nr:dihydrofolate reductase family protein [Dictyobacter aurantiacus]GCE03939.1 hypothetical protein KDAU_12680 [Dictyobacter aurantiacus]